MLEKTPKKRPGKIACLAMLCSLSLALSACSVFSSEPKTQALAEDGGMWENGSFERGAPVKVGSNSTITYNGQRTNVRDMNSNNHGLVVPDGNGGLIVMPGQKPPAQNPNYTDARELKLKMRELAAQLVASLDGSLAGYIALPTAFVSQDDFARSSSLGRYIVEQMFHEFNQRGLRTKEFRMSGKLTVREDGEFILQRQNGSSDLDPKALYLVGTYYTDNQTIFVNARLIRHDGQIVRTGQLIMPSTPLTARMLANSGRNFAEGSLEVLDFYQEARPPTETSVFDQGMNIN